MYDNVVVVGICSRTFFYEKAGVRILRMISDMLKASTVYNTSAVHYEDTVCHFRNCASVMGDENQLITS